MDEKDIAALLEAACERPLADGQTEPSRELQAFCREALRALAQNRPAAADGTDPDRLTAALAALYSGGEVDAARQALEELALRTAESRLDAQSALAFLEAVEQAPQPAPAHLVEAMLVADRATRSAAGAGSGAIRSLIPGGSGTAWRWRWAAACAMLVVAGMGSWSILRAPTPAGGPALPQAKTTSAPAPVVDDPAAAMAARTAMPPPPCGPLGETRRAKGHVAKRSDAADSAEVADPGCGAGHEFADRPAAETDAIARRRAEVERQAAAARAAEAAAKSGAESGAAQAGAAADRPMFGPPGYDQPAASRIAPAMPAARPTLQMR